MKNRSLHLIIAVLIIMNVVTLFKLNTLENNIDHRIRIPKNSTRGIERLTRRAKEFRNGL